MPADAKDNPQQAAATDVVAGTAAEVKRAARQAAADAGAALKITQLREAEAQREGGPRQGVLDDLAARHRAADEAAIEDTTGYDARDYEALAAAFGVSEGMAKAAFVWTGRQRLRHEEAADVLKALEEREV